jgi:hypothetical protein
VVVVKHALSKVCVQAVDVDFSICAPNGAQGTSKVVHFSLESVEVGEDFVASSDG